MTEKKDPEFALACPQCQLRLRVRSADLGTRRTCPNCKSVIDIPVAPRQDTGAGRPQNGASEDDWQPPVEFPVVCDVCATRYFAKPAQVGHQLDCPDCGTANEVKPSLYGQGKPFSLAHLRDEEIQLHEGIDQPEEEAQEYRVLCAVCESTVYCQPDQSGKTISCPDCGSSLTIPPPPPRKAKRKHTLADPNVGIRPAADVKVQKVNADALLAKATEKYWELEREKPRPPARPFLDGVWSFPFYLNVIPVVVTLSVLGCLIPFVFSVAVKTQGLDMIFGMVLFIPVALLCLVTYFVGSISFMTITQTTAMGYDRVERWPSFDALEWLRTGAFFFTSFAFGFGPGVSLAAALGLLQYSSLVSLPFGFLAFPFVFLSMLDMDSPAIPFSPFVWRSIRALRGAWCKFYLATLLVTIVVAVANLVPLFWDHLAAQCVAIVVGVISLVVYFRLVGRLAWVIDSQLDAEAKVVQERDEEVAMRT